LYRPDSDGVADILKNRIHPAKSLIPPYTHMHKGRPDKVKNLSEVFTEDMHFLTWDHKKQPNNPEAAQYFVVYRFRKGEKVDIGKAENIRDVTPDNFYILPYEGGKNNYVYVVTALDAFKNESKAKKIKVKQ
jgi:hypothetical protein